MICLFINAEIERWGVLNQEYIQQLVDEIQDVADNVHEMNVHVDRTVKYLRYAADFLDKVWKDCKVASVVGSGASIAGGVLSIAGGAATLMTGGAAAPLLLVGGSLGMAGMCTKIGTAFVERSINSSIVLEADDVVQDAHRAIEKVKKWVSALKTRKDQVHLVFLAGLAITKLGKNHAVVKFLKDVVGPRVLAKFLPSIMKALRGVDGLALDVVEKVVSGTIVELVEGTPRQAMSIGANVNGARTCTEMGAKLGEGTTEEAAKEIGTKVVSKEAGNTATKSATKAARIIIGVNVAFLIVDVLDFTFTVQDIVKNEGCNAARILRDRADEYQRLLDA